MNFERVEMELKTAKKLSENKIELFGEKTTS